MTRKIILNEQSLRIKGFLKLAFSDDFRVSWSFLFCKTLSGNVLWSWKFPYIFLQLFMLRNISM